MKRMACVFAVAAGAGLGLASATAPALAEPGFVARASGLQLAINSTSTSSSDDAVVLGVSYRGGQIDGIALYIDGNLIKTRALTTRSTHGSIRFELDANLLSEGEHEVVIRATDPEGNTATATTQLRVTPSVLSGPARLLFPRKNATVQGVVPIEVQLDTSIHKPYVSFFVDNDFLELTNFAPFTYNWDSSKTTNGAHTISVDVIDGETQAKIKTLTIHVNVNNPGGLTNRQTVTPDLSHKVDPIRSAPTPLRQVRQSIASAVRTALPDAGYQAPELNTVLPNLTRGLSDDLRTVNVEAPHEVFGPLVVRSVAPALPAAVAAPNTDRALSGFRVVPRVRPGALALFSAPSEVFEFHRQALTDRHSTGLLARPRRAGNFAAIPGEGFDTPAPITHVAPITRIAPIALLRRPSAPASTGRHASGSHRLDIAFDNAQIAFDVPPRVENGLPLAPFRQIFEHTGGEVQWFGHSQTVRAINSSREIQFRIGHSQATVNNQPVQMDAKPYIDRGRAIVPLSFVRDALNVTVHYDPATGHLRIESRK